MKDLQTPMDAYSKLPLSTLTPAVPTNAEVLTDRNLKFRYDLENAPKGQKLQLLNRGGVALYGTIGSATRSLQEGIWAWSPLPIRDREEEKRRGLK
jgi:hypothetical protein